jgi:hypothetical protein
MESGNKFFTAKNLVYLNKQVKAMYKVKSWPELDDSLPSLAREWCDSFSNYRISDDLRVLNSEFLKYMSTFFHVEMSDPIGVDTESNKKVKKYAGEFMSIKDPFLAYQDTHYHQIQIDPRSEAQARGIFGDVTLGDMPIYDMLNGEERYFLKQAFDSGAKSMKRTEKKQTTQDKVFEDYLKDSLETGHGRKFYKLDEGLLNSFYKNENKFYDTFDPRAPGTAYDLGGIVPRLYTRDQTPYNVAGQNLTNPRNERRYVNVYAGAKY